MSVAANTIGLYFLANNGTDTSGLGRDLTAVGTPPYVTVPAPPEGTHAVGPLTTVNHFTAPAALRSALDAATAWSGEVWYYKVADTVNAYVWSLDDAGLTLLMVTNDGGGNDQIRFRGGAGTELLYVGGGTLDIVGAWHHIAEAANASKMEIWLDGALVAFNASSGLVGASTVMRIGTFNSIVGSINAYCNQMRFSDVVRTSFPTVDTADATGSGTLLRRRRR